MMTSFAADVNPPVDFLPALCALLINFMIDYRMFARLKNDTKPHTQSDEIARRISGKCHCRLKIHAQVMFAEENVFYEIAVIREQVMNALVSAFTLI